MHMDFQDVIWYPGAKEGACFELFTAALQLVANLWIVVLHLQCFMYLYKYDIF